MLNFGGQTRRRVINLGNQHSSTSKKAILLKAEQERKRRALDRERESAVRIIQKYSRRWLTLNRYLTENYTDLSPNQLGMLLIILRSNLFKFNVVKDRGFDDLLSKSQPYMSSCSTKLNQDLVTDLLNHYKDDRYLLSTLSLLNFDTIDITTFMADGFIPFLVKVPNISEQSYQIIGTLLHKFIEMGGNDDSWLYLLYERVPPQLQLCTQLVKFNIFPKDFAISSQQDIDMSGNDHVDNSLDNLCFMWSHIDNVDKNILLKFILEIILSPRNIELNNVNLVIIEKSFIESILSYCQTHGIIPIDTIDKLLQIARNDEDKKTGILRILLIKQNMFTTLLYEGLLKLNEEKVEEISDLNSIRPEFRISIELTNFYLQFATDSDLQYQKKSSFLPLDLIKLLTELLKKLVFQILWNCNISNVTSTIFHNSNSNKTNITEYSQLLKDEISLLTQLYLRDSRSKMISNNMKKFWVVGDESFLNVDLYNILVEYEKIYQDEPVDTDIYHKRTIVLDKLLQSKFHGMMYKQYKKLNILVKTPFFIPFEQRVDYFYFLIETDRVNRGRENALDWLPVSMTLSGSRRATISRENLLDDAFNAFSYGADIKSKLSVTFVNEFGVEEGVDGGGVTKEFLTSVIDEGFKDSSRGFFTENEKHELYPCATKDSNKLKMIKFLGKIVGKCLYDQILVDLTFADFVLKMLLTGFDHLTFDDLKSFDMVLYNNLNKLLEMSEDELQSMGLTFETTDMYNMNGTMELKPNGANTTVNKQNVSQYVWKTSQYKLRSIARPSTYQFLEGLNYIIPQHWFGMFNTIDFQMLISGGHKSIDIVDLKEQTEYGGFEPDDVTVRYFWEVLEEFDDSQRRDFLRFVTSVPQAPLKGFSALEPKFGIRNGGYYELDRLPTASTCVNLLKLPDYQDKTLLREKLLYAIHSGARFDLS